LLKTRVITALTLAPAGIALVILAPSWLFRLVIAFLMLIGTWEFRRLAGLGAVSGMLLFFLQLLIMALMFSYWPQLEPHAGFILLAACCAWCLMFLRLAAFHDGAAAGVQYRRVTFLSALLAITFCTFSLAWIREQAHGEFLVFTLLIMIWAADIGAYFSGRQFGRTKLAPLISPKKTWEGVAGGVFLAGVATLVLTWLAPGLDMTPGPLALLVAVTVMTSVCGDLFISLHKRTVQMKDAGNIFPGHGGVLDRFDSLMAGAPFYAFIILVFRQ